MPEKIIWRVGQARIEYIPLDGRLPVPVNIPLPPQVTLILDDVADANDAILLKVGDPVKPAEIDAPSRTAVHTPFRLQPERFSAVTPFRGDLGQVGTAVSIDTTQKEDPDDHPFAAAALEPTLGRRRQLFRGRKVPAGASFKSIPLIRKNQFIPSSSTARQGPAWSQPINLSYRPK